jgi:hypothetical protein
MFSVQVAYLHTAEGRAPDGPVLISTFVGSHRHSPVSKQVHTTTVRRTKMNKEQSRRCQFALIAVAIASIILLVASSRTNAQAGIGKKYGSRDPRTCADRTQPKGNTITAAKAKEYIECSEFYDTQNLYLVDEVVVQTGSSRPYNPREDMRVSNIDVRIPVTPIRGHLKKYQCGQVNDIKHNAGENCFIYDWQNAKGLCYKDSFGDWQCTMSDGTAILPVKKDVPPPGGATVKNTPVDQTPAQTQQPGANAQKTENKDQENLDQNGYPKPDFSDMEKYFDIVRYEYSDSTFGNTLNVWAKPKTEVGQRGGMGSYWIQYLDKDGALVFDEQPLNDNELNLKPLGQTAKTSALAPSATKMKKVATIKIVKHGV